MARPIPSAKNNAERLLGPLIRAGDVVRVEPVPGKTPTLVVRVRQRTPERDQLIQDALRGMVGWRVEIAEGGSSS